MNKKTFASYLIDQIDRDDPVGDLSRDFAEENTYHSLREMLKSRPNVHDKVIRALEKAHMEWKSIVKGD